MDDTKSQGIPDLDALILDLMSINKLLPTEDNAVPAKVSPDRSAREAIEEMQRLGIDQIPVVTSSGEVLGVFSFRLFAEKAISVKGTTPIVDLPVDEFIERPMYAHVQDDISSVIDQLLERGYLLIESPRKYMGTLTPAQASRGLHDKAQAFILLQNIEILLRAIIEICIPHDAFQADITTSLGRFKPLEDMVFSEYEKIVSTNWKEFEPLFGRNSHDRTLAKLKEIREIRNTAFHFKYELTSDMRLTLVVHRDWLVRRAKTYWADTHGKVSNEH